MALSTERHNRKTIQSLKVMLWGTEIGTLSWNEQKKTVFFFFSDEYFQQCYDICPITYPKDSPEAKLAICGSREDPIFQGLPPFIADALPDQWGNSLFDAWFARMNYHQSQKTTLTKLAFIGKTAMGALEFIPEIKKTSENGEVDMGELYYQAKEFENMLNGLTAENGGAREEITALGTSPGGSRSKAVVSLRPDGTFVSGKTATNPEYKHYIIKFNTELHSLSESEVTYYEIAKLAGIDMMPSTLIEINGIKNFATERFDRQGGDKVFIQTFAAINQCDETYENLFQTCRTLNFTVPQMEEMFRRTVFNFLMNNTDDHRKNFSFIMDKNGVWKPSLAYDLTFILNTGNTPCDTHRMSLMGKFSDVTKEDLLAFAKENDIENAEKIINEVIFASMKFRELAVKNGIRPDIIEIIEKRIDELRPQEAGKTSVEPNLNFRTKGGTMIENAHFKR